MRRTFARTAALLIGLACTCLGAAAMEVQTWPVDKGTTAVLVEDHRAPVVELQVDLPVGTWSPWARENHLEEAFEVMLHDRRGRLRARADELGLDLRLGAGAFSSRLELTALRQDLAEAVRLVHDIFRNKDIDRHVLSRWHKSRLLRWEGSLKNPHFVLSQGGARMLFADGDSRRWRWEAPMPVLEDVSRLLATRDAMIKVPGRVIAVAGDVDRDTAEKLIVGLLPPVTDPEPKGLKPVFGPVAEAGGSTADRRVELARLTQVYFALGRSSLRYTDPLWPQFMVADHVLGGHFLSRLSVALRHSGGETYGARTVNRGGETEGLYAIVTHTHTANAEAMEEKIRQVLARFHRDGISEEERLAAVGYLRGRLLFDEQSPRDALERAAWELRHGYPQGFRELLATAASKATLQEINSFIDSFYDPARFTMIRVQPE